MRAGLVGAGFESASYAPSPPPVIAIIERREQPLESANFLFAYTALLMPSSTVQIRAEAASRDRVWKQQTRASVEMRGHGLVSLLFPRYLNIQMAAGREHPLRS